MPSGYVMTDYDYYGPSSGMGTQPSTNYGTTVQPRMASYRQVAQQAQERTSVNSGAVIGIYDAELLAYLLADGIVT
jgi:hypothetical protein